MHIVENYWIVWLENGSERELYGESNTETAALLFLVPKMKMNVNWKVAWNTGEKGRYEWYCYFILPKISL